MDCKLIDKSTHFLAIMKPQKPDNSVDLFRAQLSQMLNMSHPLVRLCERMNWAKLEDEIDLMYSDNAGQPPVGLKTRIGNIFVVLSTCNTSYLYTRRASLAGAIE